MPTGVYVRSEECNRVHREAHNSPESREKHRQAATRRWRDREYRKKHKEAMIEAMNRFDVKKSLSKITAKLWQDRKYRRTHIEMQRVARARPEVREKGRQTQIKNWHDPEYWKKQMKARHAKPNKAELKLKSLLQQISFTEYKFVGNGEFILAGKCPDFVNVNGQKKIIELYGTYWHKGETGEERIALFRQYGYETLIVWENELKDEDTLEEKLLKFNEVYL